MDAGYEGQLQELRPNVGSLGIENSPSNLSLSPSPADGLFSFRKRCTFADSLYIDIIEQLII